MNEIFDLYNELCKALCEIHLLVLMGIWNIETLSNCVFHFYFFFIVIICNSSVLFVHQDNKIMMKNWARHIWVHIFLARCKQTRHWINSPNTILFHYHPHNKFSNNSFAEFSSKSKPFKFRNNYYSCCTHATLLENAILPVPNQPSVMLSIKLKIVLWHKRKSMQTLLKISKLISAKMQPITA